MASGKEVKAAFKKAPAWGTAVAVTDDDVLLIKSEKLVKSVQHLPDDSAGQAFHAQRDLGLITCAGDVTAYLRYQGLEALLAMALGTAGAPTLVGSATAYQHQLRPAGDTAGLFGTLALYKGAGVHEFASAKVDGFTISGEAGQPLSAVFHLICDDLAVNTTGGTNTVAAVTALADPATGGRVLFRQGQFLINDAGGAALDAATDAIAPNRFSLTFRRNLAGDHLAGGGDKIAEPTPAGFPEATLTLEFPTYTTDTYLTDLGADTRKKASIGFTGGEVESGTDYSLEIMLPHVVITNAEAAVNGAGKIAHPVTCALLAADAAPAGMSGVTGPVALDLVNARDTDPLA
jgi:hypothetical protein